jgi:hypothetical protein
MNKLLSNALLCGVMASTVILVNCQKAPNKPVQAQINTAKPTSVVLKTATCTPDIINMGVERQKIIDNIYKSITGVTPGTAGDELKVSLRQLAKDLGTATDNMTKAISALTPGGPAPSSAPQAAPSADEITSGDPSTASIGSGDGSAPAGGANACNVMDSKDATKIASTYSNDELITKSTRAISSATAISDPVSGDPTKAIDNKKPSEQGGAAATSLDDSQILAPSKLIIKAEIADTLIAANVNGKACYVDGEALTSQTDCDDAMADAASSTCIIGGATAKLAADTQLNVVAINPSAPVSGDESKKIPVDVTLGTGSEVYSLQCRIIKDGNPNKELRNVLGDMVSIVPASTDASAAQ